MGLAVYELADLPGYETTILTYRPGKGETLRPIENPNVRVVVRTFPLELMPRKRAGLVFLKMQAQRVAAIVRFNAQAIGRSVFSRPDIVHIHSPMHVATALAGKMCGAVTCLTIHGSELARIEESAWIRRALAPIDIIFCMTRLHQRTLSRWFPDKRIVYVANGTDIDYFAQGRREASTRDKEIVGVGTLRWHKDFGSLIEAFSRLAKVHSDWRLTILGEGPDREKLAALSDKLGISDRVSMPGSVSREELRDTLQRASIFALSSVTEGIPKALLEAMASGCACVSTDVGDCGEVLGSTGLIVPPGDVESLAEALCSLSKDPSVRHGLSEAAIRRVHNYTWGAYREKHLQTYREALKAVATDGRE